MTVAISFAGQFGSTKAAVVLRHPRLHLFPSMDGETVGDRLRRFRRLRGLTQEQLSERAGVRRDYIGNLERGAISVPRDPEQLRLLAGTLGVTLKDLAQPTGWYDDEPPTDALSAAEAAVLSADISDEHRQAALVMLRALLRDREPKRQQDGAAASGS